MAISPRRAGRYAAQFQLAQGDVFVEAAGLALADLDAHRALVVRGGGEDARLLDGNRHVSVEDALGEAASDRDAEGARGDVEQDGVVGQALAGVGQVFGLNSGAPGHDLVGIEVGARRPAEVAFDLGPHERHARRAADHDDLVDLRGGQPHGCQHFLRGLDGAADQPANRGLEDIARDMKAQGELSPRSLTAMFFSSPRASENPTGGT